MKKQTFTEEQKREIIKKLVSAGIHVEEGSNKPRNRVQPGLIGERRGERILNIPRNYFD